MEALGVRSFVPARPVGMRCSHAVIHDDGRPRNKWSFEISDVRSEMDRLHANDLDPKLTWAEHKLYWEQVCILVGRAQAGRVRISERPDADAKVLRDLILELRPVLQGGRPAFGRRPRQLRLYYGEPDHIQHCLLALHLDTKEADETGLEEQDDAIEEAIRRANAWAQAA